LEIVHLITKSLLAPASLALALPLRRRAVESPMRFRVCSIQPPASIVGFDPSPCDNRRGKTMLYLLNAGHRRCFERVAMRHCLFPAEKERK